MKSRPVTSAERRWVLVFALGVIALTGLPYLLAFFRQPSGFSGFLIGVEDGNSYIAKMLLGGQGDWLFRSPYSVVAQHGALLYLPYLLLGKLLGPGADHASLVMLYHIYRAVSIVALCFACYEFFAFFLRQIGLRRLGLALATLGGGLGWLLLLVDKPDLFGSLPLDFYSPETFGFLAVFGLPHLVLARALLLWGLLAYFRASNSKSRAWLYGFLWLGLALTHLITAGLGLLLIALHLSFLFISQKRDPKGVKNSLTSQISYAAWAVLGAGPVFLFNALVFWRDSYLRAWAVQNQILSPNPLHYALAYGWVLPFAYVGLRYLLRQDRRIGLFLSLWLIALPILLYIPFGLQRRLAEGAWVILVVLALIAFDQEWGKKKPWANTRQQLWLFALAFPSTVFLLLGSLQVALHSAPPIFLPSDEAAAFDELRQQSSPGQVVLAPYLDSNELPAWAPLRVLVGHGPESVGPKQLAASVFNFYERRISDEQRQQFLSNYDVDYFFWGPNEAGLGKWDPSFANFLRLIVKVGDYEIFAVTTP
jgi:hypothetical protein